MGTIDMQAGGSITLEDGAQLKATNSVPVNVQKGTGAGIWQAIAPPVGLKCGIANAKNLTSADLMRAIERYAEERTETYRSRIHWVAGALGYKPNNISTIVDRVRPTCYHMRL